MTSLLVDSVEFQEDISFQVPWELGSSGHCNWGLLAVVRQSLFEDRQSFISQQASCYIKSFSSRHIIQPHPSSLKINNFWIGYGVFSFFFLKYVRANRAPVTIRLCLFGCISINLCSNFI